jgi:MerR HTH family regulatory protein
MATRGELDKWMGTGVEAAIILEVPYRTLRGWALKLKLLGRRGHRRYSLRELFKFRVAGLLYSRGFSTRNIRSFFSEGLPWILTKLTESPDEQKFFLVQPIANDEVSVVEFSEDQFSFVHELMALASPDSVSVLLNMGGIAQEVGTRLACHLDKVPYVSQAEHMKEAFAKLRKERQLAQVKTAD